MQDLLHRVGGSVERGVVERLLDLVERGRHEEWQQELGQLKERLDLHTSNFSLLHLLLPAL